MEIDIEFLELKSQDTRSGHGNIDRISDSVFEFTVYNFLQEDETDVLDGHFTFFVNYKTFDYLVYQSSDYGSFTYTIPVEFGGFFTKESLSETSRKRVESTIASKLLGAYFHDGNAVNSKGKNLFSDGTTPEEAGINIHGKKYYRYNDGSKISLICDYRAYNWVDHVQVYSDIELKALNILCGYKQPNIQFDEVTVKSIANKLSCKKEQTKITNIDIDGVDYTIIHEKSLYGSNMGVMRGNILIASDSMIKSVTKFIKNIPIMLNNYSID